MVVLAEQRKRMIMLMQFGFSDMNRDYSIRYRGVVFSSLQRRLPVRGYTVAYSIVNLN